MQTCENSEKTVSINIRSFHSPRRQIFSSGSVSRHNANRADFIGRYEIDFSVLTPSRRKTLRDFTILRNGMTRGFRFLAPDDSTFDADYVGVLNPTTNEVDLCLDSNDEFTEFYTIKYFADAFNNYTRRIVKISPYEDFVIQPLILNPPAEPEPYPLITFPAIDPDEPIPTTVTRLEVSPRDILDVE